MKIGVLRLRQRWIDREVSPSLTAAVAVGLVGCGFVLGVLASRASFCFSSVTGESMSVLVPEWWGLGLDAGLELGMDTAMGSRIPMRYL